MTHNIQNQNIKTTAQTSSKASLKAKRSVMREALEAQALEKALSSQSFSNFPAIIDGFVAMGIDAADIEPRVNVFTFNAWKAKGRVVMRGQKGVKIVTVIPCEKIDEATGDAVPVKKVKKTTVFHISQTEALEQSQEDNSAQEDGTIELQQFENAAAEALDQEAVETEYANACEAYEAKQEAKRERYASRAVQAKQQSDALCARSSKMASVIPFGQPILIGHHSEKRDRGYRAKIGATMDKSIEAMKKADYYAQKAASVGKGGISSDDPAAVQKLREQLEKAEKAQAQMKAANKIIKKHQTEADRVAALIELGLSEKAAAEVIEPDFCGRVGFPAYALTNNNANIKRLKQRIEQLQRTRSLESTEITYPTFTLKQDVEDMRICFVFDGKPASEIREILKKEAFKWSPGRSAWVRQISPNAIAAANRAVKQINFLTVSPAGPVH